MKLSKINIFLVLQIFLWFIPYKHIEGNIIIKGTHVFPTVTIRDIDGKEYIFDDSIAKKFKHYAGQKIKIKAKVKKEREELADRSYSFTINVIYEAEIIN